MATTMTGRYEGHLRTELAHLRSQSRIFTDAPPDNQGRGEAFSPTDLVAAALSSCMMTLMGILAQREGIDLTGMTSEIEKVMSSNPRKISEIRITFTHPKLEATEIQKQKLIHAARTCPVALSLAEGIRQEVQFNF